MTEAPPPPPQNLQEFSGENPVHSPSPSANTDGRQLPITSGLCDANKTIPIILLLLYSILKMWVGGCTNAINEADYLQTMLALRKGSDDSIAPLPESPRAGNGVQNECTH